MGELQEFLSEMDSVFYWGICLILVFPIIMLILSEVTYVAGKKDAHLKKPLKTFKNFILPLVALVILLTQILNFERGSLYIKIIETIVWVLVINSGLSLFTHIFLKQGKRSLFKSGVPQLFMDIFRVFMVLCGGAIILSTVWNQNLTGLVTALGLGSFVIGLALQDTLGNLFSGIALVYEKPFSVGDFIKVDDQTGKVTEMNWRAVHMQTRQKELLVMPHMMIAQASILNYSKPARIVRLQREMGFSYSDAPNRVKEALMETCLNTPGILHDPLPEVKTVNYADSAIVYELEFAINDFNFREEISDELMSRLWYTARRYNFTIPFPQRTIHYAETAPTPHQENEQHLEKSLESLPNYLPIKYEKAKDLQEGSQMLYYGKNETIFSQGDSSGRIFVLTKGRVELYAKGSDGKDVLINSLEEGDFFGEVALLSKRKSSMTAKAATDIEVMVVLQNEVMDMVSENPALAFKMGEVMENRKKMLKKSLEKK
ncbi:mechanosensitive ion channel [Aggregatimonas sangjinii]|uniref:Mechanosensitive ion channel n=1 Tax=Aggregatimonas sangjinii TaxID=2583587 RepID=A0A5B7SQG6_9FLAO|nr:mechanosensitive ion channel family protein [Aggregatimonas sangjinii]QCX00452.1 mechanosensitive ion channel [Aggregatimonas sangjinii]